MDENYTWYRKYISKDEAIELMPSPIEDIEFDCPPPNHDKTFILMVGIKRLKQ